MGACTLVAGAFHHAKLAEANIVMVFLLGVIVVAAWNGRGPSVFASFAGVVLFDVLFVPPVGSLRVADLQYLIMFAVMLGVALLTSALTERIRRQAAAQVAIAVERDRLREAAQATKLQAEAERLRNSLLSSVSHDLRTPLATIAGASSSLLELGSTQDEATRQELLKTICDEASHLSQFVENILQMTRLQSGGFVLHKEWQPAEEVIGSALGRMEKALAERPVSTHVPEDLPMAPFDGVLIEQVLVNLLDNAAKHTPPGSPIEVSASAGDRQLAIEVADRGPGVPEEEREHIFEKFYRIRRPGVKAQAGTGLGLSICQAIVGAHGGRIWVADRPGGGASFRFALPIEGSPPQLPAEEAES
jgi:two-component system sensor histidine kinase KdpD